MKCLIKKNKTNKKSSSKDSQTMIEPWLSHNEIVISPYAKHD